MLKRIIALSLCALLLFAALPISASAASEDEVQRICDQIRNTYWKTYSTIGTLHGYCGAMAGWELYYLGVTDKAITKNGNEMYDALSSGEHINEGYRRELYPATSYTIEEALNTITNCGTTDAYNIMAGFHWTTTAAGNYYGHVTVIHAILDGMVYFTEGFTTPFNVDPSQPMICTIEEFADYYDSWTQFEGIIHFGRDNFVDGVEMFACNQFVRANAAVSLLSYPDLSQGQPVRTVQVGERLCAVSLCKNSSGALFYQIADGTDVGYIAAALVEPVVFEYNDLTVTDVELPTHVELGQDIRLSGTIRSEYNKIYSLVIQVCDTAGKVVREFELGKNGNMVDLGTRVVNSRVDISDLPQGNYTYYIYCDMLNHRVFSGNIIGEIQRVCAVSSAFAVGNAQEPRRVKMASQQEQTEKNGWEYEGGNWYYYENNVARTGWFCDNGVDYYLQEDGSAATGWMQINGKNRFFTETGAMRIGWVNYAGGRYFMLSNGEPAKGMKEINGKLHYFSEIGRLVTETVIVYEGRSYQLDSDGIATVK